MICHNITIFSNISDQKWFAVLVNMIDFISKISKKIYISAPKLFNNLLVLVQEWTKTRVALHFTGGRITTFINNIEFQ